MVSIRSNLVSDGYRIGSSMFHGWHCDQQPNNVNAYAIALERGASPALVLGIGLPMRYGNVL